MIFLPLCDYSPPSAAEALADDDLEPAWRLAGSRVSAVLTCVVEAEQGLLGFEGAQMAHRRPKVDGEVVEARIRRTQNALKVLPEPAPIDRLALAIAWRAVCWEWIASFMEWVPRTAGLRGIELPSGLLLRGDYGNPIVWSRNPCFETVLGPEPTYPVREDDTGPVFLSTLPEAFMAHAGGWTTIAVQAHRARYWHHLQAESAKGRPPVWDRNLGKRGYAGPTRSPKWYRSWDESRLPRQRQGSILHELLPLLYDEAP